MAALVSNKHLMRDGTEARRNPKSMVAILDYLLVWLRKLYEDGFEVWDASTRTYFRFSPCARNFSLVTSMPRDHASVCRCYGTLVRVVADGPALQSLLNREVGGTFACALCHAEGHKERSINRMVYPASIASPRTTAEALERGQEMDMIAASLEPSVHRADTYRNRMRPHSVRGYFGTSPIALVPNFDMSKDVLIDLQHAEKWLGNCPIALVKGVRQPAPPRSKCKKRRNESQEAFQQRRESDQIGIDSGEDFRRWREVCDQLEQWKADGTDIAAVEESMGASLRRPYGLLDRPAAPFSSSFFVAKTHNLHVLLMTLFEFVFTPLVKPDNMAAILPLVASMRELVEWDGSLGSLVPIQSRLQRAVSCFMHDMPCTEHGIKVHEFLHFPAQLREWGFVRWSWVYQLERLMGILGRMSANPRFPVSSISDTYHRALSSSYTGLFERGHETSRTWQRVFDRRSHLVPGTGTIVGLTHLALRQAYTTPRRTSGWTLHGAGKQVPMADDVTYTEHMAVTLHCPRIRAKLGVERPSTVTCDYVVICRLPSQPTQERVAVLRGFVRTVTGDLQINARLIPSTRCRLMWRSLTQHVWRMETVDFVGARRGSTTITTLSPQDIIAQALVADGSPDSRHTLVIKLRT